MKKDKIIYWVSTIIVALMMAFSAFAYLTNPEVQASFIRMGFPDYFRIELAIAKLIGALVLLIPGVPNIAKMGAYVGFVIVFVSAFIAHLAIGDPISAVLMPVAFLVILLVSYQYEQKQIALIS